MTYLDFQIGQKVTHPDIYWGREVFEVVGIRRDELELRGDWSGGTHNVDQSGWYKIEGMRHWFKYPFEGGDYGLWTYKTYGFR